MKTNNGFFSQFASTFKEWHYFVGGGALGFLVGFCVALYFVLRYARRQPVVEYVDER